MKTLYVFLIACAITSTGFSQSDPTNFHLQLRANMGTANYHTDFYFNDNSTSGVDRGYDAAVFNNTAPSKAIYSKIVDGSYSQIDIAIQSLATEFLQSTTNISLGINVPAGQPVVVSINDSNLPNDVNVFLEDSETGIITMLSNEDYAFTPSTTLNTAGRFLLRFTDQTQTLTILETAMNDLKIYSNIANQTLVVKGQLAEISTVTLYDIQGRLVLTSKLVTSSTSNPVDVSNLGSGVYVVKVSNSSQQKTLRVILN